MWVVAAAALLLLVLLWPYLTSRRSFRLRARGKFYFSPSDVLWTLWRTWRDGEAQRGAATAAVERIWPRKTADGGAVVALSVRTAFDLWLQVLGLPEGSEVVFSGVTIK